jgi:hypothetical protein
MNRALAAERAIAAFPATCGACGERMTRGELANHESACRARERQRREQHEREQQAADARRQRREQQEKQARLKQQRADERARLQLAEESAVQEAKERSLDQAPPTSTGPVPRARARGGAQTRVDKTDKKSISFLRQLLRSHGEDGHKEWRGLPNEEDLLRDELKRVEQQQVRAWAIGEMVPGRTFFIVLGVAIALAVASLLLAWLKSAIKENPWLAYVLHALYLCAVIVWIVFLFGYRYRLSQTTHEQLHYSHRRGRAPTFYYLDDGGPGGPTPQFVLPREPPGDRLRVQTLR